MFALIPPGNWRFLLVVHTIKWINDHYWANVFSPYYTKSYIEDHMVFYVIMENFLATRFMNKFTNIDILTYFLFIQIPSIETKLSMICILTNLRWNVVIDDQNWMKKPLVLDNNCNNVII